MNDINTKLTEIFQEVFGDKTLVINDEMTAAEVADWDSITHISLIFSCEQAFNIKFTLAEIAELKNVGELKQIIAAKQN